MRQHSSKRAWAGGFLALFSSAALYAHDPVFGLGPHTLFKGGTEVHLGFDRNEAGDSQETISSLQLAYGLTGNWTARIELPYEDSEDTSSGAGDMSVATKYRFWRRDSLGVQESSTAFLRVKPDTASNNRGTGTTDAILGLAYGYESRKWYRWAAVRYRFNGETSNDLDRGDKLLIDLVGGIRFKQSAYLEPDWVWMLELNGERTARSQLNGNKIRDSGGTEWFLSPGLMWTLRNFAIKTGVQLPVMNDLHGDQEESDYRGRLEFEWHL